MANFIFSPFKDLKGFKFGIHLVFVVSKLQRSSTSFRDSTGFGVQVSEMLEVKS